MATYKECCEVIADAFNGSKCETKLTAEDIWTLHPGGELWWLSPLYDVAKEGTEMLEGLILTDSFYAHMFVNKLERKAACP